MAGQRERGQAQADRPALGLWHSSSRSPAVDGQAEGPAQLLGLLHGEGEVAAAHLREMAGHAQALEAQLGVVAGADHEPQGRRRVLDEALQVLGHSRVGHLVEVVEDERHGLVAGGERRHDPGPPRRPRPAAARAGPARPARRSRSCAGRGPPCPGRARPASRARRPSATHVASRAVLPEAGGRRQQREAATGAGVDAVEQPRADDDALSGGRGATSLVTRSGSPVARRVTGPPGAPTGRATRRA